MKNRIIVNLVNGGILAASAHSLPMEHFYKWFKFRKALEKQYLRINGEQKALEQECGIEPGKKDIPGEDRARFNKSFEQLLEEESGIKLPAKIPFEYYKGIYDENRSVPMGGVTVDVFANLMVESAVMEYLFTEPVEDENEEPS